MRDRKKLKLKKFYFHPITMFIVLTLAVLLLSGILSLFQMQATYNTVNANTNDLEPTLVAVESLLNFDGMKFIISNASKNFISFAPLVMLLISLIGISIAESTGFIEAFAKRHISKLNKFQLTFIVILLGTVSTLINEIGYAILIPLAAMIYLLNNRNPLLGIITAFCGVSFGYGVSIFVGSLETWLIPYTTSASHLIDTNTHIALTSNLFIIIASTIILSIVGTLIVEKFIAPKMGRYREKEEIGKTEELSLIDVEEVEQQRITEEKSQKRGLRFALITGIIVILVFIYMVIPGLPYSGLLLDMTEKTYLKQLFGDSSYFQDGFTYMVCLFFLVMGLAYAFGSKSIKNDKEIIEKATTSFNKVGSIIILIFVVSQFIAVFRKTNIGTVITAWLANVLNYLEFSGLPLILLVLLLIAISNLFLTAPLTKWVIFSPVVVPVLMQSNISPQFAQFILRAGDSMTNGVTPLLASFALYIGYLNIYNLDKSKPIGIKKAISYVMPYFLIISATWVLIVIGWYLIGLPIGPGVYPTI